MRTLVVLAAGIGSRYGGLKQLTPLGPKGEALLDLSIRDAASAGFDQVVLIIRHEIEAPVREHLDQWRPAIPLTFAYQDDLKPARDKPWGTSHALLATRDHVEGPLTVINADDYYGAHSMHVAIDWLDQYGSGGETPERYALVGFPIELTLSPEGPVARGTCELTDDGHLVRIVERFGVRRDDDGVIRSDEPDEIDVPDGTLASVNFWCFPPSIYDRLDVGWKSFHAQHATDPKTEFLLPDFVGDAAAAGEVMVDVLPTTSQWFGVTYVDDDERVRESLPPCERACERTNVSRFGRRQPAVTAQVHRPQDGAPVSERVPDWEQMRGGRHRVLGYRVDEHAGGRSVLTWVPTEDTANPVGMVHGGYVAMVVDDTCGTALQSLLLPEWRPSPTAHLSVDFLRGIRVGETYTARGVVVRAGRRLTVADCTIVNSAGELRARGTCHFAVDLSDTDLSGFSAL